MICVNLDLQGILFFFPSGSVTLLFPIAQILVLKKVLIPTRFKLLPIFATIRQQ